MSTIRRIPPAQLLLGIFVALIAQDTCAQAPVSVSTAETPPTQETKDAPIEEANVGGTLEPGGVGWELVRRRIPNINHLGGPDETYHYQYYLSIKGQSEILPLARGNRAIKDQEYGFVNNGLDGESLAVSWVREDDLIHVFWKTHPSGHGGHFVATELLLKKEAKNWKELYRNSHFYACSMGAGQYYKTTEDYLWNRESRELTIRREELTDDGWIEPLPLGIKNTEGTWYKRKATVITERRYRIEAGQLKYVGGQQQIDPGEGTFHLTEVAKYLDEKGDPAPLAARIRALNPSLEKNDMVKGRLLVETSLPAQVPDTKHYYFGGE